MDGECVPVASVYIPTSRKCLELLPPRSRLRPRYIYHPVPNRSPSNLHPSPQIAHKSSRILKRNCEITPKNKNQQIFTCIFQKNNVSYRRTVNAVRIERTRVFHLDTLFLHFFRYFITYCVVE